MCFYYIILWNIDSKLVFKPKSFSSPFQCYKWKRYNGYIRIFGGHKDQYVGLRKQCCDYVTSIVQFPRKSFIYCMKNLWIQEVPFEFWCRSNMGYPEEYVFHFDKNHFFTVIVIAAVTSRFLRSIDCYCLWQSYLFIIDCNIKDHYKNCNHNYNHNYHLKHLVTTILNERKINKKWTNPIV